MADQLRTLLLVEDSEDDEILSLNAISASGVPCEIGIIRHGGEALRTLIAPGTPKPDLIVLDFHLPGLNGLEVLREVRGHEKTRHIPVVMLSAESSDRELRRCLDEGANSCVQKPMDADVYKEHVAMIVRYWLTVHKQPLPATV